MLDGSLGSKGLVGCRIWQHCKCAQRQCWLKGSCWLQSLTAVQSWGHYEKLLKDLLMVCQLSSIKHWPQLQEFLLLFAKQAPGPIARSAMHMAVSGRSSAVHDPCSGTIQQRDSFFIISSITWGCPRCMLCCACLQAVGSIGIYLLLCTIPGTTWLFQVPSLHGMSPASIWLFQAHCCCA